MEAIQHLIFFGIVFIIYGLINFYLFRQSVIVIPQPYKKFFVTAFVFVALSFFAGRIIERYFYFLGDVLLSIGSFWLAFMFYLFLCCVFINFLRLINQIIPFFPEFITHNIEKTRRIVAIIILLLVTITVVGGYLNTKMIITKTYKFKIKKNAGELKSLNVVMASDIHLGTIIGKSHLAKIKDRVNELNPDIVLLAGDIIDEDISSVIKNNVGEELARFKTKYGIYAVTGNHEYIGGVENACKYLSAHGVNVLRDSAAKIDNSFYLVGREDRSKNQFTGNKRKELYSLMKDVDKSFPIILMDHQPFGLNEAVENNIDLQLSGHTHYGQLWPLNYIVEKIYNPSWGYVINGNTHYYVSCGVGGWGPLVRTGSRPEIINFIITFSGNGK